MVGKKRCQFLLNKTIHKWKFDVNNLQASLLDIRKKRLKIIKESIGAFKSELSSKTTKANFL